jgi:hypothetical protein
VTQTQDDQLPATDELVPEEVAPAALRERPADVPEKFWDMDAGSVRVDTLLKSYADLERKLSLLTQGDGGLSDTTRGRLLELLGRPGEPNGYAIEAQSELIQPDPELNTRLHEAGFTNSQAQLVYDLAGERLMPMLAEVMAELDAQREVDRLQQQFGGAESWQTMSRHLRTWAESNLEPEVYATLASSFDGVMALHKMAQLQEPQLLGEDGSAGGELSEAALGEMVRDPRYWRQRDPAFIARVTAGFKKLYAG